MMTAQEKPDMKTLNYFRALFHEANKVWCPEESRRLRMFVEEHFVYRLIHRFGSAKAAPFIAEVRGWIRTNYDRLVEDNRKYTKTDYKIPLRSGVAVFVLHNGTLRIQTCYIPEA